VPKKRLYNIHSKEVLREKLSVEAADRTTLSFYKYVSIDRLDTVRDELYHGLDGIGVLGRIYIATEGINGQITVPSTRLSELKDYLDDHVHFADLRLNIAVQSDDLSFVKLIVRQRTKIVADGLDDRAIDFSQRGEHVDAQRFNDLAKDPDTLLIDMRNHYESEVGHFQGALRPSVATFRESLPIIAEVIAAQKPKQVLMYCTGGIRCEKASAYFKSLGHDDIYQLDGGIINYAHTVDKQNLENRFVGKNFVFDERLGERITEDVLAECHQCGDPCDQHTNCSNDACHLLFIQCKACAEKFDNCCSSLCRDFNVLTESEKKQQRRDLVFNGNRYPHARYSNLTGLQLKTGEDTPTPPSEN